MPAATTYQRWRRNRLIRSQFYGRVSAWRDLSGGGRLLWLYAAVKRWRGPPGRKPLRALKVDRCAEALRYPKTGWVPIRRGESQRRGTRVDTSVSPTCWGGDVLESRVGRVGGHAASLW